MTSHEFWREIASGEVWAVELQDGAVRACRGPLHWSEIIPTFIDRYEYVATGADRLERRRTDFEALDELSVAMLAGSAD